MYNKWSPRCLRSEQRSLTWSGRPRIARSRSPSCFLIGRGDRGKRIVDPSFSFPDTPGRAIMVQRRGQLRRCGAPTPTRLSVSDFSPKPVRRGGAQGIRLMACTPIVIVCLSSRLFLFYFDRFSAFRSGKSSVCFYRLHFDLCEFCSFSFARFW